MLVSARLGTAWMRRTGCALVAAGMLLMQACASIGAPTSPEESVTEPASAIVAAGIRVSFENISFVIPSGLGTGVSAEVVPAVEEQDDSWFNVPAYKKFMLTGYPIERTILQPHIFIYPAEEFESVNPTVGEFLKQLRTTLGKSGVPNNEDIPAVPMFRAAKVFGSQITRINTQNGAGVRMLTSYSQDFSPITNDELIYQFQGFTNDGKYYILVSLPIHASFLLADEKPETVLPADGIPFPDLSKASEADVYAYDQAVADKMSETDPDSFQPALKQLDALIESMTVTS
jgi:hypothetical protein